jgi:hypothetical protein
MKKSLTITINEYKNIYKSSYNNKEKSNFTINFEGREEVIFVNKLILSINSTFFENIFKDEKLENYTIKEDFKSMEKLIQFYYTGSFNYNDEQEIINFLLLGKKYESKLIELKFNEKGLLRKIVEFVEKDIDQRKDDFDFLMERVDFRKVSSKELKKLRKEKEWLQNNTKFLQKIISIKLDKSKSSEDEKSSDDDSEDSKSSKSSESETSESEESDDEGVKAKFDIFDTSKSSFFKFEKKGKLISKLSNSHDLIYSKKCPKKLKIKVIASKTW